MKNSMNKKVTMLVWNQFYNDSRVLRECTTLVQSGYSVNLIALGETKSIEKRNDKFCIHRISFSGLSENKLKKNIFIITVLILFVLNFVLPIIISLICVLVSHSNLRFIIKRVVLVIKMTVLSLRLKTDIYHANDLNTLIQATICAKIKNKKLIFDSHEINTSRSGYDSWIYPYLEKKLIFFPDYVIHENNTRAKYIENLYGFRPEVIYNYPYLRLDKKKIDLHSLLGLSADELLFVYQGGIQEGRGLEQLIQAVPLIKKGVVVFIGDGKIKDKLIRETRERGLQNRVKFVKKVPLEVLHLYTRNAYLGFQVLNNTCFNHYSAASNKLFEYMMAGVPVVGCSFPEIKQVILKEKMGILVDSSNPESIANAVNYLVDNKDVWLEFRENALKSRLRYCWEEEQTNLLKIYNSLVK